MLYAFALLWYAGTTFGLSKLFAKADQAGWKAYVPFLNIATAMQIVGRPMWQLIYFLIPVVNLFFFSYLAIEIANSFRKYAFSDHLMACVLPFIAFPKWGGEEKLAFHKPDYTDFVAYHTALAAAQKGNIAGAVGKVIREYPQYEKSVVRDWTETAIFAIFAATFIRMFLIEAYTIPTSSMEGSLLVGDYMFVSKTSYGMRTPNTIIQLPLVHNTVPFSGSESYLDWIKLPYHRINIPFLSSKIERYDPVVFNFPEGDTIAYGDHTVTLDNYVMKNPGADEALFGTQTGMRRTHYYGYLRQFGRRGVSENFNLVERPVDKRDNYIKRCVGLPGDKIQIKDRILFVNDKPAEKAQKQQFRYLLTLNRDFTEEEKQKLKDMSVENVDFSRSQENKYAFHLHQSQFDEIRHWKNIDTMYIESQDAGGVNFDVFPHDTAHFKYNVDNFGPIEIPSKGKTINLTLENIALYRRLISVYEQNSFEIVNGKFKINGLETTTYTPKMDYYWMMGDNRHNSEDARIFGFVPEDHIVGKPLFIWFSRDQQTGRFRWERLFTGAKKM
jgi:signal peptidase I